MVDWFKWKTIGIGGVGIGLILTGVQLALLGLLQFLDWDAVPDLAAWQTVFASIGGFLLVLLGIQLDDIADERLEQRVEELQEENGGENE